MIDTKAQIWEAQKTSNRINAKKKKKTITGHTVFELQKKKTKFQKRLEQKTTQAHFTYRGVQIRITWSSFPYASKETVD